jgi:hypothetical protein
MAFAKRIVLVGFVVLLIAVVFLGIFTPSEAPRILLNQHRAVLSIEDVSLAERKYAARHPETGYACNLSDLGEQGSEVGLVDPVLASGTKAGYHFKIQCAPHESQTPKVALYAIIATPVNPGTTGKYAVCTDQSGQIWYNESGSSGDCWKLANRSSKEIGDTTGRFPLLFFHFVLY